MAIRFVCAAVALTAGVAGCGPRTPAVPVAGIASVPLFTDVTTAAGLRFTHVTGETGRKLLPETMGGGVIVFDFDGDGRPDVFLVNGRPWSGAGSPTSALYRNAGDGTFTDVTAAAGLAVSLYGMGGCAGDFDNDGFPDLFVTAVGGNRLYRNVGGKRFEDVTEAAGLKRDTWPTGAVAGWDRPVDFPSSATWLDFDGDGRLDLFACDYVRWSPATDLGIRAQLPGGKRAYVPPTQFPGTHGHLYRNLGGGRFADVSAARGIEVTEPAGPNGPPSAVGKALGVVACDPDGDGWPDLIVANDTVRNFFFHNIPDGNGGRTFEEIGLSAGVAYTDGRPRGGMGIDAAYLQPDTPAVVVANFTNEPNTLLARTRANPLLFHDIAAGAGLAGPSRGPMKFGAAFLDFDLDGRTDLFTANGHLEPDIALARPTQTHAEAAQLFRNVGTAAPTFVLVPDAGDLTRPLVGRGCAVLDYNGDGRPDLVVAANGGPAKLFRNDHATGNRWVRLKLVGDGVRSNRDAIGARVEASVGGVRRTFHVAAGRGYLSQSELDITIGLGANTRVESVTVYWPGQDAGTRTWTNLSAGRVHRLEQ